MGCELEFTEEVKIQNRVDHHRGELVIDSWNLHIVRLLGWAYAEPDYPVFIYENSDSVNYAYCFSYVHVKHDFISLKERLSVSEYHKVEEAFSEMKCNEAELQYQIQGFGFTDIK